MRFFLIMTGYKIHQIYLEEFVSVMRHRASKSCRHADAHLLKIFNNLHKMCIFEHQIGKTGIKKKKLAQFEKKSLNFYMFFYGNLRQFLWAKISVRKFASAIFLLLEGLMRHYASMSVLISECAGGWQQIGPILKGL